MMLYTRSLKHLGLTLFWTAAAAFLLCGIPQTARGQGKVGIYWDNTYTRNDTTTTSTTVFPEIMTGYLVLKYPSNGSGLQGWECCVEMDGPGLFLSWALEGQAFNFSSAPCFRVVISGPPLPSQGNVLLGTFQIMVTEYQPLSLALVPDDKPSLPWQMSYNTADDPGTSLPMTTVTGQPEVAWINRYLFELEVDPPALAFDNSFIGAQVMKYVTVTNHDLDSRDLDISLTGECGPFTLPGFSGPVTVPGEGSLNVAVAFDPLDVQTYYCGLILNPDIAEVPIIGNGIVSYADPTEVDFGDVGYGYTEYRTVTISNPTNSEFIVYPSIPASCPEFQIDGSSSPMAVRPGFPITIDISFSSTNPGAYSCELGLGGFLPPVPLQGVILEPRTAWAIDPPILDFASVAVGATVEMRVSIQNTGNFPFPVDPAVAESCSGFFPISGYYMLHPGYTSDVVVGFSPQETIEYSCSLNLGDVLPDIPLAGTGFVSPSGVETPSPGAMTRLLQNVPNPFNPQTEIRFELAKPQQAHVAIYDVTGRLVTVVEDGHLETGPHTRVWQGRDSGGRQVPSGVYYVRMETRDRTDHLKIMLLK